MINRECCKVIIIDKRKSDITFNICTSVKHFAVQDKAEIRAKCDNNFIFRLHWFTNIFFFCIVSIFCLDNNNYL